MKKRLTFFYRKETHRAPKLAASLGAYIKKHHPNILIGDTRPHFVVALGGDGTILEAARIYGKRGAIIIGLNLGHVGFLASARRPREFTKAIDALASGAYTVSKRMMATGAIYRGGKKVYGTDSLNEIAIQGLSGMIKLIVSIDGHPLQYIHGSGVLVATPTGSTAYNLSAHGPIVTPDIQCFVITELLDHHIPTPSIVVKRTKTIEIEVAEIRAKGLFTATATGEPVDAVLTSDDANIFPLREGDRIVVGRSKHLIKFAEFTPGYFYKSLQEKFAFR
ncbi:MAG: NAD(+)/NADH kinase [bacterium]|nr:NAD(+)/NADH kinase [bacterium]